MIYPGRWRVDHQPTLASTIPVVEWFEHKVDAEAREAELKTRYGNRAVAWWWPADYAETPAEETVRYVRERLTALMPWLREAL